jgi:catalase
LIELVAPRIGGVVTSDGELIPAHQKVDGGPSVLYDAVAILASAEGAAGLATDPAAKDFVTDAHQHCKLIAYQPDAAPLLDAAGVLNELDDGYLALETSSAPSAFLERCRGLRQWDRTKVVVTA